MCLLTTKKRLDAAAPSVELSPLPVVQENCSLHSFSIGEHIFACAGNTTLR